MRTKVNITDTRELVAEMSEGNPGALSVLVRLLKERPLDGPFVILHMDDMNIRGTQIWLAYKDHCGQDINALADAVTRRDPELVATVNRESGYPEYCKELATVGGASYTHAELSDGEPQATATRRRNEQATLGRPEGDARERTHDPLTAFWI
jgi:hypothetical protein